MYDELKTSFLGALQASVSVLLVISYGVVASQFNILQGSTTKQINTLCVRIFLPALLFTNVGSQLHAETGTRYVPILSESVPTSTRSSTQCNLLGGLIVFLCESKSYGDYSTLYHPCFWGMS